MAKRNNIDVLGFLCSWQQLSAEHKAEGFDVFTTKQKEDALQLTSKIFSAASESAPTKTFDDVQLYSYYSYLYYYPTMSWFLDRTPETDDYWVGIYPKGAKDNEYITYQWLKKTAQGSYYIGKLSTTAGKESRDRWDEFELRLFKGDYQFVDAVTNVLWGTIDHAPTDPDDPNYASKMAIVEGEELDPGTREVIEAVQKFEFRDNLAQGKNLSSSLEELRKQWNVFTQSQQQLLLPVLEQEALPDRIKKPDPKDLDRPEPKMCFPNLGKAEAPSAKYMATAPETIVLTISLKYSYTYIYPMVNVVRGLPEERAWMGVYRSKRCMHEIYIEISNNCNNYKCKNIFIKMFLHLFHWFLLCVATRINLLTFVQSSTSCKQVASNCQ